MIVALTVLALLMLIGGLAAVVQGIPFVRLEVGWTMVIAGTVGASGGAVLLGITAAVARLGRIERALASRPAAERIVAADSARETVAPPVRAARSEPVLPPIPFPAPPASEPRPAEPTGFGGAALAAGAAGAAAGLAASELRLTRAEDPDLPAGRPEPESREPASHEPDTRGPALHEPVTHDLDPHQPDLYAPPEPAPHDPLPPSPPPAAEEPPVVGDVHDAPPPAPEPPASEPIAEAPRPEESHADEPPFDESLAKTVIGTYDSGGNTYTMYADGTIDAETPAGRFHFASIEELKAFRGAGGEGAARRA
ncbi:hypothetical protein [Methylobacterium sp. Gmos1]